ncbi:hypothetical protein NM208_g2163 [Fusarium decemcellulare]|uniref:Uncharacterized protein n=1 Tax=Fusarium decemcellulare TaxID=57161 RepID=A0ACC1SU20_9HYPO|nr:hypothetical protein NM208_g2163 [Fusarium decemcellulare]
MQGTNFKQAMLADGALENKRLWQDSDAHGAWAGHNPNLWRYTCRRRTSWSLTAARYVCNKPAATLDPAILTPDSIEPSSESPSSPIPVELEGQCTDNAVTFPEHPSPSSPAKMNLCERIIGEVIENTNKLLFVPADVIDALSSRPVVEAELKNHASGDLLNKLVDYVVEGRATKVFLTLAVDDRTNLIKELYGSGLCDDHLPLEKDTTKTDDAAVRPMNKIDFPPDWKPFHRWSKKARFDFCEKQWYFMAPVFTKKMFSHKLPKRCPVPLITEKLDHRGGLSGSVNEVGIHEAHQKVLPKMGHYFLQEQETLRIIRNIDNDHLIMPIASYSYHNEDSGFFLFPWAEGGNLRDFWTDETIRPLEHSKMMSWALKQMCGLCQALSTLHHRGRRHGDLKPENILLFHEGEYQRMLKIADVGLAKFHEAGTQERIKIMQKTNTMTGTTRYVSPEFIHADVIPRKFDVWALGCVFVEFLIWMLYGDKPLKEFNGTIFDHFWEKRGSEFVIHSVVQPWLDRLSRDLDGSQTALAGLLDVVVSRMLVPAENGRGESDEVYNSLAHICTRATAEPAYLMNSTVWSKINTRNLPKPSRATLEVPGAPGLPKTSPVPQPQAQSSSASDGAYHEIPVAIGVGTTEQATQSSSITFPTTTRIAQELGNVALLGAGLADIHDRTWSVITESLQVLLLLTVDSLYQLRRLNDVWHSRPDNEFAKGLFARSDWSYPSLPSVASKLCQKCAIYDIWAPGFERRDLVRDLNDRAKDCEFCTLLSEAAAELGKKSEDELSCQRVESNIRVLPDGPTILSIYSDPAQVPASQNAQVGYPMLPEPGSTSQFAFMNEWIRTCQETHHHDHLPPRGIDSRNTAELPTRVIDVGNHQNPKIKLIDSDAMESSDYVALSHCWGQGTMYRALVSNVESLRREVDFNVISRTSQDAILATRGLNARYLWIDTLCIIQDDEADWKREAARMQHVFSNAICVLAASSATSSAEGFLRNPHMDRKTVILRSSSGALSYVCKFIDNFNRDVEEAPLNKRGWVLQERALARRSIHFTSTQLYMECGKGVQCESLMKLANEKAAFLGDSDFPNSILPYYKGGRIVLFQNLFTMYSGLNFSHISDRSIAISGLERRLVTAFKSSGGYGIFDLYLERSLLWKRLEGSSLALISYPSDRSVPTWSWMAYNGRISYLDAPFDEINWTKDYESPFKRTDGKDDKKYWEASGANPVPGLKSNAARKLNLGKDQPDITDRITFDLTPVDPVSALRCIVIGKEKTKSSGNSGLHYVLIIGPSPSKRPGHYVRVGVAVLLETHILWELTEYVEVH